MVGHTDISYLNVCGMFYYSSTISVQCAGWVQPRVVIDTGAGERQSFTTYRIAAGRKSGCRRRDIHTTGG